jgi:hypothetical protein
MSPRRWIEFIGDMSPRHGIEFIGGMSPRHGIEFIGGMSPRCDDDDIKVRQKEGQEKSHGLEDAHLGRGGSRV